MSVDNKDLQMVALRLLYSNDIDKKWVRRFRYESDNNMLNAERVEKWIKWLETQPSLPSPIRMGPGFYFIDDVLSVRVRDRAPYSKRGVVLNPVNGWVESTLSCGAVLRHGAPASMEDTLKFGEQTGLCAVCGGMFIQSHFTCMDVQRQLIDSPVAA